MDRLAFKKQTAFQLVQERQAGEEEFGHKEKVGFEEEISLGKEFATEEGIFCEIACEEEVIAKEVSLENKVGFGEENTEAILQKEVFVVVIIGLFQG